MDAEFASRYLDAWNWHSIDEILTYFAPACTYIDVALNESHTGEKSIYDFISHMESAFSSDYQFEPGTAVVAASGYAIEWVLKGTHDRSSAELPATGKPYSIRGVSVGEFRDGKIARNTDYWSLAEFLGQIGVMPTPHGA
jgi:steroid delta-isomerase-like uncharacterized protein